jgi:hypothetical protein
VLSDSRSHTEVRPRRFRPPETFASRTLRAATLIAILGVVVQTTAHLTNAFVLDGEFLQLDADAEGTAFAWASSVAVFSGALAAFLHALFWEEERRSLLIAALVLTFLSLDEIIQVHERIGLFVGGDLLGFGDYVAVRLWLVLYAPLLIVLAVLLLRSAELLPEDATRTLRYGLAALVTAIALEGVGLPTKWLKSEQAVSWPDTIRIAAEEAAELAGWILVSASLIAGVCQGAGVRGAPASGNRHEQLG